MDASTWIALAGVALAGCVSGGTAVGVYVGIRVAIAELKTGFGGVVELLRKQDERITFIEQRSMQHHPEDED